MDPERLSRDLAHAAEAAARKAALQQQLASVVEALEAANKARREAAAAAAAEAADVARVTRGPRAWWLAITGGKEDAVARETMEADAARALVQEARARVAELDAKLDAVRAELDLLDGAQERFDELRQTRRTWLIDSGHPAAGQVLELEAQLELLRGILFELRGARDVGLRAYDEASDAGDAFRSGGVGGTTRRRQQERIGTMKLMDGKQSAERFERALRKLGTNIQLKSSRSGLAAALEAHVQVVSASAAETLASRIQRGLDLLAAEIASVEDQIGDVERQLATVLTSS